jgi:arylsulfatase
MMMKLHPCLLLQAALSLPMLSGPAAEAQPARPNVILILADDLGWSDLGCYGGEIRTPNLDRLAASAIRFTQFYNSAKCEPTRASLMSGQYWQDVGLGIKTGITMGQAMRAAGYATFAVGKWHMDGNPVERGFDRYFGHLSGASDYFKGNASHRLDDKPFEVPKDGTFYTTDANADFAIQFITESRKAHPEKPFFVYLAFNAPHGPIQAWPEDIAKYRGQYRTGWDKIREQRYQRMVEQGIFKKAWALSPRPDSVPAWDTLSEEEQEFEDLRMSIFAAMVDRMDQAIGRVLSTVKNLGEEQNTLVMFLSDNGGSPYDRGRRGTLPDPAATWEYGLGWAHVSCTPFRHYKRNMYNGGAATPFIACWPEGIKQRGTITDQQGHIIDLMATLVDVSDRPWPGEFDGEPIAPLPGRSLRPVFAGEIRAPHERLYFHLMDHRAVIQGDWKLASDWNRPWELFNLAGDRTELHDLAPQEPARFHELATIWSNWWSGKNPALFKSAGGEPVYRHLNDKADTTQGGNDEPDQTRPARRNQRNNTGS